VNLIKVYYMHVWKYHNETPLNNHYMLIKKETENLKIKHTKRSKPAFLSFASATLSLVLQSAK
jgi:hypothetical protein